MAELAEIERIAREVVNANTAPGTVVSVAAKEDVDWEGDPLIRVSVEITPEGVAFLSGKAPLNILVRLSDALSEVGEDRTSTVDYATTAELEAAHADSEP